MSIGIVSLLIIGWEPVTKDEFVNWRLDQLRQKQITDDELSPKIRFGDIVLEDYFRKKGDGYFYLGGLGGTYWNPGEKYQLDEIEKGFSEYSSEREEAVFSVRTGENNLYVNLDQGGKELTKKYLQALDQYQVSGFDTLFIDFRFMRQFDFSQLIALFNQLGPQEKTFLGTVINPYQEVELKTSGQPFFYANQYVFLVHENLPDPLKGLVGVFGSQDGYRIRGTYLPLQDSVCVYTDYEVEEEFYRICADHFVPARYGTSKGEEVLSVGQDEWQELFSEMEKNWYRVRDTAFMDSYLPVLLGM